MKFPGREKQIQFIQNAYERTGSGLLILYGDQGLGKTTILLDMRKEQGALYYQAVPGSEKQQAAFFREAMRAGLGKKTEEEADESVATYQDCFQVLAEEKKEKTILMIDDFEHLLRAGSAFSDSLQILLNHGYSDTDFLVILCTSSLGFVRSSMARKLGRAATQLQGLIKVRELSFSDAAQIRRNEEIGLTFRRYALFGGNLAALNGSLSDKTEKDMICHTFLNKNSSYYDYGLRFISENLRELNVYATILYAISQGRQKLNDLYQETGFSRAKISVYLKNLMELDIVEKVYSYGGGPRDDSQKGIYRIANPMILFWYKYVYGHKNELEKTDPVMFYTNYIENHLNDFYETAYVNITRQLLCENKLTGIAGIDRCEEWVGKSGDIPIIALGTEGQEIPVFCRLLGKPLKKEDLERYQYCMDKAGMGHQDYIVFTECGVHMEVQKMELKHELIASVFASFRR